MICRPNDALFRVTDALMRDARRCASWLGSTDATRRENSSARVQLGTKSPALGPLLVALEYVILKIIHNLPAVLGPH